MRACLLAVSIILILAGLAGSGCGPMSETGGGDVQNTGMERGYRPDSGGFRYPGPPLTGGGN